MKFNRHLQLATPSTATPTELLGWLAELMVSYPSYAYVANEEGTGARAVFRGRWRWQDVAAHVENAPSRVILADERASGFVRFRLYGDDPAFPAAMAEIEVYFARGDGRTTFWCEAGEVTGALGLAA